MNEKWEGLLPKSETGASSFVKHNDSWDGHGVIVGILDTGVDPGAPGLQITSKGLPKLIDTIDCTGSGDVVMGKLVVPQDGCIVGLSGRTLTLGENWKNPSGSYRLGLKRAFELYPRGLRDKVLALQKKKRTLEISLIEKQIRDCLKEDKSDDINEDLEQQLISLRELEKTEFPGPVYDCLLFHDGENWNAIVDTTELGDLRSLEPMVDYRLKRQFSRFSDDDCLNFSVNIYDDGNILSIVVDSGSHGTHVAGIVGAYFPDNTESNGVAPGAQLISLKIGDSRLGSMETGVGLVRALLEAKNRGCNIINMSFGEATAWDNYGEFIRMAHELVRNHGILFISSAGNNGPALSTVGAPGGTSSAIVGIGALFPESMMNVAYSLPRQISGTNYNWSSMGPSIDGSLGVSLIAPGGAITCVPNWTKSKKSLMNGTSMSSPNAAGCFALLWSAALSHGFSISPTMIRRCVENSALLLPNVHRLGQGHGLIQVEEAWKLLQCFQGVSWADVPIDVHILNQEFSQRGLYLRSIQDTSFASTFKVELTPIFPENCSPEFQIHFEVRLVMKTSANWIQCSSTLEMLSSSKVFSVYVDPSSLAPGLYSEFINVYDENHQELGPIVSIPVTVTKPEHLPSFVHSSSSLQSKWELGNVVLEPGQRLRKFFHPPSGCQYIDAIICDCRASSAGQDSSTLLASRQLSIKQEKNEDIQDFDDIVDVDDDENMLPSEIEISNTSAEFLNDVANSSSSIPTNGFEKPLSLDRSSRVLVLHALQIYPGVPFRDHGHNVSLLLTPASQKVVSWKVKDDWPMELCLCPSFSTYDNIEFEITLYFRGVQCVPPSLFLHSSNSISQFQLFSRCEDVVVQPSIKFDCIRSEIAPLAAKTLLTPLGERDLGWDGRPIFQLILEYSLDLSENSNIITRFEGLQGVLYESDFHSQLFFVINRSDYNKIVYTGDSWPSYFKASAGKYVVRLQVRHFSSQRLESLTTMPMILERKLKEKDWPNCTFHSILSNAVGNPKKSSFSSHALSKGRCMTLLVTAGTLEKPPKYFQDGDILLGSMNVLKKSDHQLGNGDCPGGYPVHLVWVNSSSSKVKNSNKETNKSSLEEKKSIKSADDELEIVVRKTKLNELSKHCGNVDKFSLLFYKLESEYGNNSVELKGIRLSHLMACWNVQYSNLVKEESLNVDIDFIQSIFNQIDNIVNSIQVLELVFLLSKLNVDQEKRMDAETNKKILLNAYFFRGQMLVDLMSLHSQYLGKEAGDASVPLSPCRLARDEKINTLALDGKKFLSETIEIIKKWEETKDDRFDTLEIAYLRLEKRNGILLKKINDLLSDATKLNSCFKETLIQERLRCLQELKWSIFIDEYQKWIHLSKLEFPPF